VEGGALGDFQPNGLSTRIQRRDNGFTIFGADGGFRRIVQPNLIDVRPDHDDSAVRGFDFYELADDGFRLREQ